MIRTAIAIFLLLIAVSARAETPGECIVLGGRTLRHDSWGPAARPRYARSAMAPHPLSKGKIRELRCADFLPTEGLRRMPLDQVIEWAPTPRTRRYVRGPPLVR